MGDKPDASKGRPEETVLARLVRQLAEAEAALQTHLAGQTADTPLNKDGRALPLPAAQAHLISSAAAHRSAAETQAAILNAIPAHIALLDPNGVILVVNDSWKQFASANSLRSPDFGVGASYLTISELASGDGSEEAAEAARGLRRVLRGELNEFALEYPCHSPTEQIWFRMVVTPVSTRRLAGAVVMHLDITERRKAEAALRESEARFRGTFEQSAVGIAHVSKEGRLLRVNNKFCSILGYTQPELLALTVSELVATSEDSAAGQEARRAMLAGELSVYRSERRYRRKNGEQVWADLVSTLQRNSDGEPQYFISVLEDITPRKEAEFRLKRLNRLHTVLSRIGEAIVRQRNRQQLYDTACRILVEDGLLRMASILEVSADAREALPVASFGPYQDYIATIKITLDDGPSSRGTIGTALRTGRHDFCNDIRHDPRMTPWRENALANGFLANASFPLTLGNTTIGALALFAGEAGYFELDEIRLLTAVAGALSFALDSLNKDQQRQEAESGRRASDQRFARAFENAAIGMALVAPDGRFLKVNRALAQMLGYTEEALNTRNFQSITHPEDLATDLKNVRELLAGTAETYQSEKRYFHHQGHVVWALLSVSLVRDETGQPVHFISQVQDISAQRQAQEAIRLQADILNHIGQAVIVTDTTGRIIYANRFASELYGWSPEEILNQNLIEATVPPDNRPQAVDILNRLQRGGKWSGEFSAQNRDGRIFPALVTHSPLLDERGQLAGIIGISQDISENKKLEQHLLRSQRMESIGTLAGGIAHDLNNLLAPIAMGLSLLRQLDPTPRSLPVIETMEKSAKRGSDLVKQVMSFARGVEGSRVPLQIRHIISEVESIAHNTFPKNITIENTVPGDLWLLLADPTQLNQILLNLCVNARDAMPNGGRMELGAENVKIDSHYAAMNRGVRAGRYVMVHVTDNGCGIPQNTIDRIFEPFFTTKELGKGTGLGLSTVLGIVQSHGGFVNVQSEPGKGSTFKVYLPADADGTVSSATNPAELPLVRGNGELIMVVDDEPFILDITKQTLEKFGYKVVTAEDGAQAIGLYAVHRAEIKAVLTDIMMPVMDGPALIAALRRINPDIGIIAASGLNANANVARAKSAGVNHFLAKPYAADALLLMLKTVLSEGNRDEPESSLFHA